MKKIHDDFLEPPQQQLNNLIEYYQAGQYVDDEKININQKDFGESRITIENNSMVNLSKEDSDRTFKESKIIQKALNNYSKFLVPDLNFMNPVKGIISSRYGR